MISSTRCGPFEMTAAVCCSEWWCHYAGVPSLIDTFWGSQKMGKQISWPLNTHQVTKQNRTAFTVSVNHSLSLPSVIVPALQQRRVPCLVLIQGLLFQWQAGTLVSPLADCSFYILFTSGLFQNVSKFTGDYWSPPPPPPHPTPISTTLQLEEMLKGLEAAQPFKKKKKCLRRHHCPLPRPILRV